MQIAEAKTKDNFFDCRHLIRSFLPPNKNTVGQLKLNC